MDTVAEQIAFIDESMRVSRTHCVYVVAAVHVPRADRSSVENRWLSALGRRRQRVHWHNESERFRHRVVDILAAQRIRAICAAVEGIVPRRQERARELALWSLVPHLTDLAVTELVFEARQARLNPRDQRTIGAMKRSGIGKAMQYRFTQPTRGDSLLWAADVFAGSVAAHLADDDDHYVGRIPADLLVVHRVPYAR